jgi:hypothetical protein
LRDEKNCALRKVGLYFDQEQTMAYPRLNFACELDTPALQALLADDAVIGDLQALHASLSLGILDLSLERAHIVQKLNREGVPVVAWLLLPVEQGYWFHQDNAPQAVACYRAFKDWTAKYSLKWDGVGLDIEPDIRELRRWMSEKWHAITYMMRRSFNWRVFRSARRIYRNLINEIHADGYRVDIYQFPFIIDERKAESTLLQRATGIIDLPADREVLMLYSSFARPHGAGFVWSYSPEAKAIGIGLIGAGAETGMPIESHPLSWEELERDLRLAWHWTNDIFIYSLEGCVKQGYLVRLKDFVWDQPFLAPTEPALWVENWRGLLQTVLWISTHLWIVALGILGLVLLFIPLRRRK